MTTTPSPTLAEQLAQQPVALVLLAVARGVVAVQQLLRAGVVRAEVGVVGDVQLAAQHALLHLAHVRVIVAPRACGGLANNGGLIAVFRQTPVVGR